VVEAAAHPDRYSVQGRKKRAGGKLAGYQTREESRCPQMNYKKSGVDGFYNHER